MSKLDVKLMGDGNIGGGSYNSIKIMGNGRVVDDVEAKIIRVMGNCEFAAVQAEQITVAGLAEYNGDILGGSLKVSGNVLVRGKIKNEKISVSGELRAQDIETEQLVCRGVLQADSLNANDVRLALYGRSKVKEIGAENVDVCNKGFWGLLQSFVGGHLSALEVDVIEADRIYLENTLAKTVKGNRVAIGPGCQIDLVEFKDAVSVHTDAKVGQTIQM